MHPATFTMITTLRRGLAAVLIGLLATSLPAIAQGLGPNGLPLNPDAAPQARVALLTPVPLVQLMAAGWRVQIALPN